MQVAVDHSIAGSQAISGRTTFFSHTPGTFNQSWVLTQPASRATPLVEAPPTPQQQLAFPQRTSQRTPFSTISTTPLTTWPPQLRHHPSPTSSNHRIPYRILRTEVEGLGPLSECARLRVPAAPFGVAANPKQLCTSE